MNDVPLDIYIAGYGDPESAKADFDALKKAQREGLVMIDGAVLVSRDLDGTLHVRESGDHDVFKGATIGVAGGIVLGLFAPPLLGAVVVGGLVGGLIGKLAKHHDEKGIARDLEDVIPPRYVRRGRRLRGDLGRRGRAAAGQGREEGHQGGRQADGQGAQGSARGDEEVASLSSTARIPPDRRPG